MQHFVQVAFHHGGQFVEREVDAVVAHAALRKVVGADAVAAVAAAYQALARGRFFGGALAALFFLQARLQHLQRARLVAVLAAAVLAFGHQARGQVNHAHGGIGFVDVLAARAAGAEGVDAQIGRVERDGGSLVRLGHHGHGGGAGVDAALRFRHGHALHAVPARFVAQAAIRAFARHAQHHFLVAAQLGGRFAHHFHAPALRFGVAGVHAGQIACEQRRFVAARARADFHEGVALVIRVFGQQQALQLALQLRQLALAGADFFLRHLLHFRVLRGVLQQRLCGGQIGFALAVALPARDHGAHFGVLARQAHELRHVGHDVGPREQKVDFGEALGAPRELLAYGVVHGARIVAGPGRHAHQG